jgi:hypothetical protein
LFEVIGDALIEAVKLAAFVLIGIARYGTEESGSQGCVYSFEEFEENHAEGVALLG